MIKSRIHPLVAAIARPRYAALTAALLATAWLLFGPAGGDAAAHLYGAQVWREHGWRFWDNFWYAGRYSQVNYSLIYYPLAAVLTRGVVVVASVALAAGTFARVIGRQWPGLAKWPCFAFAVLAPLAVPAGTDPFTLGLAFALLAVAALQARQAFLAVGLIALTALAHPLALAFTVVALVGWASADRQWFADRSLRVLAGGAAAVLLAQFVLLRAFSDQGGRYSFDPKDAMAVAFFCVAGLGLTYGVRELAPLRGLFTAYALAAAFTFVATTPLGGNIGRLVLVMGAPLLLVPLAARRFQPRWAAPALVGAMVFWQTLPAVAGWNTVHAARAQHESFWYPALAFLETHNTPGHRVEVVATADNWEAYYLARTGIPLARGWYRQDDWPANGVLYGRVTPPKYRHWLRLMGIRYVLLPSDPLDPSASAEAGMLRAGHSGLTVARRMGSWTIYELPNATPLATPRAGIEVLSLRAEALTLRVRRAGRYRISVRYTPYWKVTTNNGCVRPALPWGTELDAFRPGIVRMRFRVQAGSVVDTVLGQPETCTATRANESLAGRRGAP